MSGSNVRRSRKYPRTGNINTIRRNKLPESLPRNIYLFELLLISSTWKLFRLIHSLPSKWPSSSFTQADKCYGEALQEFRNVSPERSFTVWPCETSASRTYFPDHQRCHQKLVAAAKASRHDDDRFLIGQMISDFLRPSHLAANFWPDLQICGNIRSAFGLRMYASGNHASIAS